MAASSHGDIVKSGWVKKFPPVKKMTSRSTMKKRWLVLFESYHLAYYENSSMKSKIKEVNLSDCDKVFANYKHKVIKDDEFAFAVRSGGRTFVFIPDNQDEMQLWCDKLETMRRHAQGLPPLEQSAVAATGQESPSSRRPLPVEPGVPPRPHAASLPLEQPKSPYMNEAAFAQAMQQQPGNFNQIPPGADENYVKFFMGHQGHANDGITEKQPYVNLPSDGPPIEPRSLDSAAGHMSANYGYPGTAMSQRPPLPHWNSQWGPAGVPPFGSLPNYGRGAPPPPVQPHYPRLPQSPQSPYHSGIPSPGGPELPQRNFYQ